VKANGLSANAIKFLGSEHEFRTVNSDGENPEFGCFATHLQRCGPRFGALGLHYDSVGTCWGGYERGTPIDTRERRSGRKSLNGRRRNKDEKKLK